MNNYIGWVEGACCVNPESSLRTRSTAEDQDIDGPAVVDEIPQSRGRSVTQQRALPTRKDRGLEPTELARPVRDRVGTGVQTMQPLEREPPTDHPVTDTCRQKLLAADDAMLPAGNPRDHEIRVR